MKPLFELEQDLVKLITKNEKGYPINFYFDNTLKRIKPYLSGITTKYLINLIKEAQIYEDEIPKSIIWKIGRLMRNSRVLEGLKETRIYAEDGLLESIKECRKEAIII